MLKIRNKNRKGIDFIAKRRIFILISVALFVVTILATIFMGVNVDIKFKGGTIINCPYTGDIDLNAVQNTAQDALGESVTVQTSQDGSSQELVITLSENKEIDLEQVNSLTEALKTNYPDNIVLEDNNELTVDTVNPEIGGDFFSKCIVAVILAFVVLIIYIGFRFRKIGGISAGIMAIIGLLHDLIIAWLALVLFGFQVNDIFMAVVLTVLGYSVNNTIVIYDRIRENKRLMGKDVSISDVVNRSINQTLSRSINSTFTVVLALLVVLIMSLIFHIDSMVSFALPMLFGIIAGAYSSICLSGPLWVWWKEKHPDKDKKKKNKTKKEATDNTQEEILVKTQFKVNPKALKDFEDKEDSEDKASDK